MMKPIIFARISEMKYYKGITDDDQPNGTMRYVKETGDAHEAFNFDAIQIDGKNVCLGFVMLIGNSANTNLQIKLENIIGCNQAKDLDSIDGVTVVWCAKDPSPYANRVRVVGFYKNATVYRHAQECTFYNDNNEVSYVQQFNFVAKEEDCTILPQDERNKAEWFVPSSGKGGRSFGFGRANVWFANSSGENEKEDEYVQKMLERIENYSGKNWMEVN